MTEEKQTRKLAYVNARQIHLSRLLPKRNSDAKLVESIRRDGIQQPIIVRPSPNESGMFEILDGGLRFDSVKDDQKVLVDIRYNVDDMQVFIISKATFKRKARTTYERSLFYSRWVKIVRKSSGSRGAQLKVAKAASLSQAEVSHYLSINRLFNRLRTQNVPEAIFNALKNQGVNKLYSLSRVEDDSAMLDVVAKMSENPDMSLEELKTVIEDQTSSTRALERLIEEDDEEEEPSESTRMDQLRNAAQELEGTLDKTREMLARFTSRIAGNPRRFLSPDVFKRIKRMLGALKRIEKEVNQIIGASKENKQGGI